jgi:RNA-directed DNA polymerase
MFDFDKEWSERVQSAQITYTRYADDLYFSTNQGNVLQTVLQELDEYLKQMKSPRLTINNSKTAFSSRKWRRLAAGLVLTSDRKISIGRKKKRMLKAWVNNLKLNRLTPTEVGSLRGWIAYLQAVEPLFVVALQRKYELDFKSESTWKL